MLGVLSDYAIIEKTKAILPVAHIEYQSIVFEKDKVLYVRKRPLELIEAACIKNFADYQGRRNAAIYQTNFKHKVPIPISIHRNIYAFPTQSPTQFNCGWIFYQHVLDITKHYSPRNPAIQSIITFKNGLQIEMSESHYILEKQMQRTAVCVLRFSEYRKSEIQFV